MNDPLLRQQRRMFRLLLIHLLLLVVVPAFFAPIGNGWDYLITALLTTPVLALFDRHYARYLYWSLLFVIYLLKEIIVSNVALAWLIMQPKPKIDPGIIAIPLMITTAVEITVLSLAIAVTPGTLVVEMGQDASGHKVLYVHTLFVGDPEQIRTSIQNGFERMILQISRGATA